MSSGYSDNPIANIFLTLLRYISFVHPTYLTTYSHKRRMTHITRYFVGNHASIFDEHNYSGPSLRNGYQKCFADAKMITIVLSLWSILVYKPFRDPDDCLLLADDSSSSNATLGALPILVFSTRNISPHMIDSITIIFAIDSI